MKSMGRVFRTAVQENKPLQILGTVNAYSALLAENAGAKAVYVSGSGVATASFGLPDLGITNLADVVADVDRITDTTSLPVLVDIDTGFGEAFGIHRTIRKLEKAGAAAVHMEDQVSAKRCGHRPNKTIVSSVEMCQRIQCAVEARRDPDFVVMARTDALASEGMDATMKRIEEYIATGADMIFLEAARSAEDYTRVHEAFPHIPILANITEWGKTPMLTLAELEAAGVSMALYPLSAHRAMAKAAQHVFKSILEHGHANNVIDTMQTRDELYKELRYHEFEDKLDSMAKK